MSEKVFMHDGGLALTYGELLGFVNAADSFMLTLKPQNLFDFLKNFSLNLALGKDTTLLDSDLSESEISALGAADISKRENIGSKKSFNSLNDLIGAIENSQSKITIFTSGTTGLPKKVSHTLKNLSRQIRKSPNYSEHVWGFAYNPTHMAGLQVLLQILFNQNTAANIFMKPKAIVYECIDSLGVTHISASPTFYRLLIPENARHESVKRITLGGEKSDSKLHGSILKIFPNAKINNIYASTEGGGLLAASGEFFRIPENLKGLVKVENGELLIHKRLLGESETLVIENDFYSTGDIVEWADKGKTLFKFVSRKSSLVNVGGYKVNIEEVEDRLRAMQQVADAAVYGRKNSVLGNILCADIKIKEGQSLDTAQVRNFLAADLQDFKIPRKIQFVEQIESTRSGKIKRA